VKLRQQKFHLLAKIHFTKQFEHKNCCSRGKDSVFTYSGTESGIGCIETGSVADETEKDVSAICETLGIAVQANSTWLVS
jgi:hypothetical protein